MPLESMVIRNLKEELEARGESRGGTKHVLQRRLHGLLVQAAIRRKKRPYSHTQQLHFDIFGSDSDLPDCPSSDDEAHT